MYSSIMGRPLTYVDDIARTEKESMRASTSTMSRSFPCSESGDAYKEQNDLRK
jgi:hypothetical protein